MPSSHITIRPATLDDFATIQHLNAELFEFEGGLGLYQHSRNLNWPYTDFAIDYFKKACTAQGPYQAFIAESNGRTLGYLIGSVQDRLWLDATANPIAEIENMFVEEAHRRHGVGSQLVAAFKAWANQRGARRLKVGTLTGNHPAIAFYRRHGFRDTETLLEQTVGE
jgi:GNAT superfamily N-acetyltransferase